MKEIKIYDYFFLMIIYLAFLFLASDFFAWIVDDLYIYFRYVNNIVRGDGIVYNAGERVEGVSGFSWLMLLSIFGFLKLPLELCSKITCLFFAFTNLILLFKIGLDLKLGRLSYLACILMMFNLPFILWSVSGFEIMFYIFLMLSAFYKILNLKNRKRDLVIISVLIFLISITRPEGVLISLAFIVFVFIYSGDKVFAKKVALLYAMMFISFLIFRVFYFGDLLPNTYYAKIGHEFFGHYELRSYRKGLYYIIEFFSHNIQFIPLIILIPFTFRYLISNRLYLFILVLITLQFIFVIFAGGDWMVQYRFIVPAIPFIALLTIVCLNELVTLKKIKYSLIYIITAFLMVMTFYSYITEDKTIIEKETILWNQLKDYSDDIEHTIPPGSYVANGSSGIIPFYLYDVIFLDVVGLTNKTIAKKGYRHGNWFEKSLPEYVYSKNPGWIIMWKRKNDSGVFTFESASPCYSDLAKNINFKKYFPVKSYDLYEDSRIELYKLKKTN